MPEGAAKWGGMNAPTTYTGIEVRCLNCGSFSRLVLSGDDFVCRDKDYCGLRTMRRYFNKRWRKGDDETMEHFLEILRRS